MVFVLWSKFGERLSEDFDNLVYIGGKLEVYDCSAAVANSLCFVFIFNLRTFQLLDLLMVFILFQVRTTNGFFRSSELLEYFLG